MRLTLKKMIASILCISMILSMMTGCKKESTSYSHTDFAMGTVTNITLYGTSDNLEQTEQKLVELLGKDVWEQFQQALIQCFLPCSLLQLFWQGFIIEITKRFMSRDLETEQEVFRLYLNQFFIEKSS